MSHNIEYFTYPKNVNKKNVEKNLNNYVAHADWQEGCSGLGKPIRWIENRVYETEDDARTAIKKMDSGWYDQIAVLFEYRHETKDEKIVTLKDKARTAFDEYNRRSAMLYSETISSALISCKKCGSKLARTYLRTNFCPVCRTDLRPEHMLKSVEAAKNKLDRANKDLTEYMNKHGKREVMWLVKIEYHT